MRIIVVGGGRTGSYLAEKLVEAGNSVAVIEADMELAAALEPMLWNQTVINGDGTSSWALEHAGIISADVVAAVTGDDDVNLEVARIAKHEYGVDRVVARINDPRNSPFFDRVTGVDSAIDQAELITQIVRDQIQQHDFTTVMRLGRGNASVIETQVHTGSAAEGKTLAALELPKNTLVMAVERNNVVTIPDGSFELQANDDVTLFTLEHNREPIRKLFV
jgi:trk system potassium uptake protein TrkA